MRTAARRCTATLSKLLLMRSGVTQARRAPVPYCSVIAARLQYRVLFVLRFVYTQMKTKEYWSNRRHFALFAVSIKTEPSV